MNDFIEALKEIKKENKDFKITLYKKEVLEITNEIEKLHSIIKEVRENAKRKLKIAEENIKNSEQWLEVEEEQEHAKKDIHTGKVVKRYMEMFLEILDKEEE